MKMNIKEKRIAKNLTQRQLGDLLGIAEGNYRKLENNHAKSISFTHIQALCKLFECTPNDIFQLDDD